MSDVDGSGPIRVALVGPAAPWRGGIAHYVDALAEVLTARGHETRIVSFRRQYPSFLFPGTEQKESGRSAGPRTDLVLDSLNPLSWRAAGRAVRSWAPDGVAFNYWLPFFVPTYAGVIRQLARQRTAVIFDCHNVLPHERRLLDAPLTRWMLRLPDRFIVHSAAVKDALLGLRPDAEVIVAPLPLSADFPDGPGREVARERLGLPPEARVLLFFGFVRAYKGLDVAIDAMRWLPDCTHLVVAGEFYDRKTDYAARIADAGVADRIRIEDRYIAREEVGVYFDAADLAVLPYHRATQSGILPLAWRFETPVVASRVGGLTEHIDDGVNGLLVRASDARALAQGITRFFEEGLSSVLRQGVMDSREKLSWKSLARVFESAVRRA